MKRRNFLTLFAALPFVGGLSRAFEVNGKPVSNSPKYQPVGDHLDGFYIMTPCEIVDEGFTYVPYPCFNTGGKNFVVKIWRLKTYFDGSELTSKMIYNARRKVCYEIRRLQLTHLHTVAFHPSPLCMHDNSIRRAAFVRGCRLVPWNPEVRAVYGPPKSYDAQSA